MNTHHRDPFPGNIEAEQALLGAILMNSASLDKVPAGFRSEHMLEPIHQEIYSAILKAKEVGRSINPVTVRSFMSPSLASARIGDIDMPAYLARLVSGAVTIVNVPDFADAITELHNRRESMVVAGEIENASVRARDELEYLDHIKECRERLTAIVASIESRNEPKENFFDAIDQTLGSTADAMAGRRPLGLYPGLDELSQLIGGGYQKGQLIIIGGGVKQGKSALAWQSFFEVAARHPVAGNSGEMPRDQIVMREKARRTGISYNRQKAGKVSEQEIDTLARAGQEMKRLQFIDIDCRRLTLDQVDEKIKRLIGERGIEAYFLDHIGKLVWTGKMEHEEEFKQGQRATSILKDMAMKHNIPIIALTHLKKAAFQDQGRTFRERIRSAMNRRPTFRDLVGNMDKDADHVLIPFQARPIIAGLEPEEGSEEYAIWEGAMERTKGKAEIILSLSRENEFPRRKDIRWDGATTSYGPGFVEAMNSRELF